jgi:hypothetical protein
VVDDICKEYMIGKLLGYTKESLVAFYLRNYGIILPDDVIARMDTELDGMVIRQSLLDKYDIRLF